MTEEYCNIVLKTFQHLNKVISFVGVLGGIEADWLIS